MPKLSRAWSFFSSLLPFLLLILGFCLVSLGFKRLLVSTTALECFCPSCPATAFAEKGAASLGLIKVDIQGAVKKPGIYQLEIGQRLADLVASAAGFSKTADAAYVAKNLNLSLELKDQDKIYIPFLEENFSQNQEQNQEQKPGQNQAQEQAAENNVADPNLSKVSINQADSQTLQSLSGIGEARAADIINNRPYLSLEELLDKKVLSASLLNSLKSQLTL